MDQYYDWVVQLVVKMIQPCISRPTTKIQANSLGFLYRLQRWSLTGSTNDIMVESSNQNFLEKLTENNKIL